MGIAGILYKDQTHHRGELPLMLAVMKHRIQGKRATHSFKNCTLGGGENLFSRNGQQQLTLALDGSLTRTGALKERLKAAGFSRLASDDATLCLNAYRVWGPDFVQQIDGHFSIAVLDEGERALYLYRDRTGKKPLYWARTAEGIIFASELKAILASGWTAPQPDPQSIATLLALGYCPQDTTPIEGVNKLLPGHFLRLPLEGGLALHPYWSLSEVFLTEHHEPQNPEEELEELLHSAVSDRLSQEPRAGCVLSGGIGTCAMGFFSARSNADVHTYSTCYSKQNDEDCQTAKKVSEALSLSHVTESLTPQMMLEELPSIVWHLDEPISNVYTPALWHLSKLAGQNKERLLLSGMGCDELLCAHTRYQIEKRPPPLSRRISSWPQWMLDRVAMPILMQLSPTFAFDVLRQRHVDPIKRLYLDHSSLFSRKEMTVAMPQLANYWNPDVFLQKIFQHTPVTSGLSSLLYFDMKTQLVDAYCHQFDRLTTAFGLNWQAPFLDEPLIRYLIGLPIEQKCTEEQTAIPLRQLLAKQLPNEVVYRDKVARPLFLSSWAKRKQVVHIFELLKKGSLVEAGMISKRWIARMIQTAPHTPNGFQKLWSILVLEVWMQLFVNNPVSHSAPTLGLEELLDVKSHHRI